MNNDSTNQLFEKLNKFIKKYYQNQLIKGGIYVIAILIIFFLLFAIIEYFSSFGVLGRTFLFWTYISLNLIVFGKLIIIPLLLLLNIGQTLNYKEASKIIGQHFTEIDDKLLNTLELSEISEVDNALIEASINQKTKELSPISFKKAIDFSINKKHLKWILTPVFIILLFFISGKDYILTESSARIIKHNTFFEPEAPFNYVILNKNLECKQFDDFLLKIKVEGNEIPREIFINWGKNTFKMKRLANNEFEHQFLRIHYDLNFRFSAGGYNSKRYLLKSLLQPKVVSIEIVVSHPKHTNKKIEKIINTGDLIVSEGSIVKWQIQLENTNNCSFIMGNKKIEKTTKEKLDIQQKIFKKTDYSILSSNTNNLSDTLTYFISVIADEFPKINLSQTYDTINSRYIFGGTIEDDYLLSKLEFIYSYSNRDSIITSTDEILIQQKNFEKFFHTINFEELNIEAGKEINYYFKVWDNDAINGSKFTTSKTFFYKKPSNDELIQKKDIQNLKTKSGLQKSILLAEKIQKEIEALNKKILEKKKIGWEERQKAKEILKKQKELENNITNTQKKNSENLKIQKKLNPSILKKHKQLEELMNKVLNEEIKKILEEMEKMIDNAEKEKLKDLLEKLDKGNEDLEKELDRELELFKQLEFEQKLEEALEKISELKQQQQNLKNKTKEIGVDENKLIKEQENLSKKMEELKKELEDLRQKNMQLKNKNELPKTQKLEEDIEQRMQKSQDALKNGMKNKSLQSQQKSIESLEKLEQKLQAIQQSSASEKPIEDMESLRKILENLIKLSFDQEDLINHVNNTPRNSSEFVKIVRQQNKLSDDSKIIEDSLFALSKRVLQIEATINQEITSIKYNMQKATKELEARNSNKVVKRQQLVMTATNNLALLLSEILEQMQKQLEMPPSKCNKPRNCNNPSPNCNKPSMSELRKAQKKLNGKMKKGGKSENKGGKKGEKQSKELINLAKQQEKIRQQLLELRDEIGKNGEKGKIDKILNNMQENERDIVNNQITQETINRQKEILTRLLEAENSDRDQDKDDKRESTEWRFKIDDVSQEFINYKQQKEAQEELLKTTPLQLAPFYRKKVNTYFNYIIND